MMLNEISSSSLGVTFSSVIRHRFLDYYEGSYRTIWLFKCTELRITSFPLTLSFGGDVAGNLGEVSSPQH